MTVCGGTSRSESWMLCSWDGMQRKDVSGRGAHRWCIYQGALVSHHHPQGQRKEVRGLVAHAGITPESPLYSSSPDLSEGGHLEALNRGPSSQRQQKLKQRSFTFPHCSNQLLQDWVLRTDSQSVTSIYMCGPRRLPGYGWDSAGPGTVQESQQVSPALSLTPSRGWGGRPQQPGCVTQRARKGLQKMSMPSAFLLGLIHRGK